MNNNPTIDYLSIPISFFNGSFSNDAPTTITLSQSLSRIKQGTHKAKITEIRLETDKEKRNKIKSSLPALMTFSSNATGRKVEDIKEHSRIMALDFDFKTKEEAEQKKIDLQKFPFIVACFISPSGNGTKAYVLTSTTNYKAHFKKLQTIFPDVDAQCSNINRLCYESYDPNLYFNPNAETFTGIVEDEIKTYQKPNFSYDANSERADISEAVEIVEGWMNKSNKSFSEGSRNGFIAEMVAILLEHGYGNNEIEQTLKYKYLPSDGFPESELELIIRNRKVNASGKIISSHKKKQNYGFQIENKTDLKKDISVNIPTEIKSLLTDRRYSDFSEDAIPDVFMTGLGGTLLFEGAGMFVIGALQKAGKTDIKTHLYAQAIRSANQPFTNRSGFEMIENADRKGVVFIDPEQPKFDSAKVMRRALKRSGLTNKPKHAQLYSFRGLSPNDLMKATDEACEEMAKDNGGLFCIFLDSIGSFVSDMNNQIESGNVIRWMGRLTEKYNCPLICSLHFNPSDVTGTKLMGSFGSGLQRNAQATAKILKKGNGVLEISLMEARNTGDGHVDTYSWDEQHGGFTFLNFGTKETRGAKKKFGECDELAEILWNGGFRTGSQINLRDEIMMLFECSTKTALRRISDLKNIGTQKFFLSHDTDGLFTLSPIENIGT